MTSWVLNLSTNESEQTHVAGDFEALTISLRSYIYTTMDIVIDSNVIFSGLYSSKGASRLVLQDIRMNLLSPVLTVSLYEEYADVIRRIPLRLGDKDSEIFLNFLCRHGKLQEVFFLWRPFLVDPKDDLVLEAAVASGCETILTHNKRHFKGVEKFGKEAMTPKKYIERKTK